MIRWIKARFAWRIVERTPAWLFWENEITGDRMAEQLGGVYGPFPRGRREWLLEAPGRAVLRGRSNYEEDARDPRPGFGI